eukprot:3057748-Rhodomonas_salina.1
MDCKDSEETGEAQRHNRKESRQRFAISRERGAGSRNCAGRQRDARTETEHLTAPRRQAWKAAIATKGPSTAFPCYSEPTQRQNGTHACTTKTHERRTATQSTNPSGAPNTPPARRSKQLHAKRMQSRTDCITEAAQRRHRGSIRADAQRT